jgi:Spy/CpxP family protein refolding chaperone
MMLAEPAARRGARGHWWKAVLAFSLALNLFFVIGALWIRIHSPAPMLSPEDRLDQMAGELGLDAHQRQAFAHYSQIMRERLQAMHNAVQPLIAGAWAEVGKPQADESKVMQLFDQAAQERRHFVGDLTTTTLSFLATLSPEQRAKFVQLARHRPRPWSPPADRDRSH